MMSFTKDIECDGKTPARLSTRKRSRFLPTTFLALAGSFICAIAASGPPTLIVAPADRTVLEGERVVFEVQADGAEPLFYQWQRDGSPSFESITSSYTLPAAELEDDSAVFSVTVINAFGEITSSNAVLRVRPGLEVTASINQSLEPEVFRGWPMLMEVSLVHPDALLGTTSPIVTAATNGPWSNAINLDVQDSQEVSVNWPFQLTQPTNDVLALVGDSPGVLLFWLGPNQTTQLAAGDYDLTATLNTTNVTLPGAWHGVVTSVPVNISLTDEPPTLTEAQFEEKQRLLARYALLQGDPVEAGRQIDALLAVYPENIGGLSFLARMLAENGHPKAALDACDRALSVIASKFPDAPEPPEALLLLRNALSAQLGSIQISTTLQQGVLTLTWRVIPGASYRLESSTDLRAWTLRETNFVESSGSASWTTSPSAQTEFFRLVVE